MPASTGRNPERHAVRPPVSSPAEALAAEFVLWSKWFHAAYVEYENLPACDRDWADGPVQFEVSAFFLFVLRITMMSTQQSEAAQARLFLQCATSTARYFSSLGSPRYVEALLRSRGEEYLEFIRGVKGDGLTRAVAQFFLSAVGGSPFHNHLRLARAGQVTPPGATPPLSFENPLQWMAHPDYMTVQYVNYVTPFIMVVRAICEGNSDLRRLPISEVDRRLESALCEASRLAVPELRRSPGTR